MNKILMLALTVASPVAAFAEIEQQGRPWTVYTHLDLFAYSEPVSIAEFARDFQDDLEKGETSFTQDSFELGLRWNNWRIAFIQRFDYITEFTEDTALIHHSEKNGNPIEIDIRGAGHRICLYWPDFTVRAARIFRGSVWASTTFAWNTILAPRRSHSVMRTDTSSSV